MVRSHCINHRLALACSDANDTVKYIQTIEVTLCQLWKWLEYQKRCSAFVKVCVTSHKTEKAFQVSGSEDTESLQDKVDFNWPKCFKHLPKPSCPDADIEAV